MAKIGYDGVVEAAHYKADGQLDWVRVYERRGAVFSDCVLLRRDAFVRQLKAGKRYMVGERILNLGGKFKVTEPVRMFNRDGSSVIVVGSAQSAKDELNGVPII